MPAAAITAAATVGGALISSSASKKASNAATTAANENNALQREIYGANTANLSPFMGRGNQAGDAYNALLGLGGDPAAAKNAFQTYLNSTGYGFQRDEGLRAIEGSAAARGMLHSGGTMKALQRYGDGLASSYFSNYLNALGNQQGVGLSGANALAGVGTNYANAVGGNNNSAASAIGNAALIGGANTNNLINGAMQAYGTYMGGRNSAYGNSNPIGGLFGSGPQPNGTLSYTSPNYMADATSRFLARY